MKFFSVIAVVAFAATIVQAAILDSIRFGDSGSERSHGFLCVEGRVAETAALGETARELLPRDPVSWQGGTMTFKMRVNPRKINYATVKLWGGDVNENMLILFVEGKQVGFRLFGDVDILDRGGVEPAVPGRFYYVTVPIPMSATYRRNQVEFQIVATGGIVPDGNSFEEYQKKMVSASRGIYRFYVHDESFFTPPGDEKQGVPPEPIPPEPIPDEEAVAAWKERVNEEIGRWLEPEWRFRTQEEILIAAHACLIPWTKAYRNPEIVDKIIAGIDELAWRSAVDPEFVRNTFDSPESEWCGFGPAGEAVCRLWEELKPLCKQMIELPDGSWLFREKLWENMFEAGVKHLSTHRRPHADQSRIVDLNLYWNNRALRLLGVGKGLGARRTLGFLRESAGIEPWSGPLDARGEASWPLGRTYRFLTAKSLAKEFGDIHVRWGLLDWLGTAYEATRPAPGEPGDAQLLDVLRKAVRAESYFRYPSVDAGGNPVMRAESVIDWRGVTFPGEIAYLQRPESGVSVLRAAAAAADPVAAGIVRQMMEEQQFSAWLARRTAGEGNGALTPGMLYLPEQYDLLGKQPSSSVRLPMSEGEPDCVFSDEENGVIAVKDGGEIFYASLYWRARHGVNFLARIHHIAPEFERIATVREEIVFQPSGMTWLRRNWTNCGFAAGGIRYPGECVSVHRGETLPVAVIPHNNSFLAGQESPYAGRGDFYRLEYGPYFVGMNSSPGRTFQFKLPEKGAGYRILPSGRTFQPGENVEVGPMSTVVLKQVR